MQQTETYKLNLIEKEDVFSPDALNENTQKVEQVLTAYQAGETAAREEAIADLDARVTTLEGKVIALGSYVGETEFHWTRTIELPFTPTIVLIQGRSSCHLITKGTTLTIGSDSTAKIITNGFWIQDGGSALNSIGITYFFAAIP